MSALHLAEGPAMYLGGSIMSFALPFAAFIVIATVLFFVFRRPHHGPRLKYLRPEVVTSVQTWEPGPVPAPPAKAAKAPEASGPAAAEGTQAPKPEAGDAAAADEAGQSDSSAPEGNAPEGKE